MDDLNSFFAKKAAKKKKSAAQDTETLVKRLEKAVRHQMQADICQEEERITKERLQVTESRPTEAEDSEWIDLQDELDMDLAGKGLKELEIEDIAEEDKVVNNERIEKPKTWNINKTEEEKADGNDTANPTKSIPAPVIEKKPSVYISPMLKQQQTNTDDKKQPNLQDTQEFPSLMAAEDFAKKEVEKKKLKAQQAREFEDREREMLARREKELQADKDAQAQDKQISSAGSADQRSTPPPQAPARYVAPALRNK